MASLCSVYGNTNTICVDTGEVKMHIGKKLSTSFLNTCCALGFIYKNIHFLAHIDHLTPFMYEKVLVELTKVKKYAKKAKINIWIGEKCGEKCNFKINNINQIYKKCNKCESLNIIYKLLNYLNKNDNIYYYNDRDIIII